MNRTACDDRSTGPGVGVPDRPPAAAPLATQPTEKSKRSIMNLCRYNTDIKCSGEKECIVCVLKRAEKLNPYKVFGIRETYSSYNEGWNDALEYIASGLHLDY